MARTGEWKVGSISTVVLYTQVLYRGNGDVYQWMRDVVRHFDQNVREEVAKISRSGELMSGIGSSAHGGFHECTGEIESTANHTLFVMHGTGYPGKGDAGQIYSILAWRSGRDIKRAHVTRWGVRSASGKMVNKGPGRREPYQQRLKGHWLRIPADEGGEKHILYSVAGQEPNNFMVKAWNKTGRRHRAISRNGGLIPDSFL
jgi:hypothetical protein